MPFHTVYMHALVRDEKGQKMSKSKGNVVDPLELMDEFGADALRFTLAAMAAQGRDIKLAKSRIEGYRNFGTKLWNAARFCQMNECTGTDGFDPSRVQQRVNRWIVGETMRTSTAVSAALEAYKFNEAAGALYKFVWNQFCDWYLEFIKPLLNGPDGPEKTETRAAAAWALDQILIMLHPFMPFITEELWQRLAEHGHSRDSMLIIAPWPALEASLQDPKADAEMEWVVRLIGEIRSVRAEMNVPAAAKVPLLYRGAEDTTRTRIIDHDEVIKRMARLEWMRPTDEIPPGSVQIVLDEATFILPLADVIDIGQEMKRLEGEIAKLGKEIEKIDAKLDNPKFLAKAPEDVVEEQRERRGEAEATAARLKDALGNLKLAG